MKYISIVVICCFIVLGIFEWLKYKEKANEDLSSFVIKGVYSNEDRIKNNLPIIPSDWKITRHYEDEVHYAKTDDGYLEKGYVRKVINLDRNTGHAISETDSYYSGQIVPCVDEDYEGLKLVLSITFDYDTSVWSRINQDYLCCDICTKYYRLYPKYTSVIMATDSILFHWGIKRLNWQESTASPRQNHSLGTPE